MPLEVDRAKEPTWRLFFALWPEDSVRDRLGEVVGLLRERVPARWVARENFHITLAFLGAVPETRLPGLLSLNFDLPEPFELVLESLDHHRRRRIIWITPNALPDPLERLVAALHTRLRVSHAYSDPRPFRAHLTLARSVKGSLPKLEQFAPIIWTVRSFALVESELHRWGVRYRVLKSWPLQALPKGTSME